MKGKRGKGAAAGLRGLSIKARLVGVLGLLGVLLIGVTVVSLTIMGRQDQAMRSSYANAIVPAQLMAQLRTKALLNFTVLGEASTRVGMPDYVKKRVAESRGIEKQIDAINDRLSGIAMPKAIASQYQAYRASIKNYREALKQVYAALDLGDPRAGATLGLQARPRLTVSLDLLNKLVAAQTQAVQQAYSAQSQRYHSVRTVILAALAFGLALVIIVSVLLVRSLARALRRLVEVANDVAAGHIGHDIEVARRDELGQVLEAFRIMDERLGGIVGEVRRGAEAVSSASQQIARGNDGLSERTQEQAAGLVETASSVEEMTATVKHNADNATHAHELAHGAREQAEHGGEIVRSAVAAMAEIDASSARISDIVRLIQDIAFQTNLLALNAAVEAARAGEQGRGFAVVASEVRSLAQRSAAAATDIKGLIADSADKVRAGSDLVNRSGEALAGIVKSVKEVAELVAEIATANHEQSVGIDQVSSAISQIEQATQQNASLVQEASVAARAMQDQASGLARQMEFFQLAGDDGTRRGDRPRLTAVHRETEAVFAAVRGTHREAGVASTANGDEADRWDEF